MAEPTIIERYQARRTRRFLADSEKWGRMMPSWRTQCRRRALVLALGATFAFMVTVGVLCQFFDRAPLLWLPACLLFFPIWTSLQIVSGRLGDAPTTTLDEWEVQQQNAARSAGLTITQFLAMIPVSYLLVGSVVTDGGDTRMAYAGGLLTLTTLMIGGCSPTMILAWTRPDPYTDDYLQEAA
ncbi:hypothetical protein [Rhodococcus sp. NPDC127528]|uniref:hypothetical protein n=1 Tax=unclassified Rhodococcus (in: high G+C Gram-positive bacteria) TaxID=192944 RepID=UPI003625D737